MDMLKSGPAHTKAANIYYTVPGIDDVIIWDQCSYCFGIIAAEQADVTLAYGGLPFRKLGAQVPCIACDPLAYCKTSTALAQTISISQN